jgi:membrane-associated protein
MTPAKFVAFNVGGGILWITSLTYAGYFFGNIPWVKGNLTLIIIGIVVVSVIPVVVAAIRARQGAS